MTFEVSTNVNQVEGRMYIKQSLLAIDEIIIDVQHKGAAAVLYLTRQFCKYWK